MPIRVINRGRFNRSAGTVNAGSASAVLTAWDPLPNSSPEQVPFALAGHASATATGHNNPMARSAAATVATATVTAHNLASVAGSTGWLTAAELLTHPMDSTTEWQRLLDASALTEAADPLANQDSHAPAICWAAAIRGVRTENATYLNKALTALTDAKTAFDSTYGTSTYAGSPTKTMSNGWLALGRNMAMYVYTADLLKDHGHLTGATLTLIDGWFDAFLDGDIRISDNAGNGSKVMEEMAAQSGSNADSQMLAVYAAMAVNRSNSAAQTIAWDKFRAFCGDTTSPYYGTITVQSPDGLSWATTSYTPGSTHPSPTNPLGATKTVPSGQPGAGNTYSVDGVTVNDMRRGGAYQWFPVLTENYPWVGMGGTYSAAISLGRAGYDTWNCEDQALRRTINYNWFLDQHPDNTRARNTTSGWWDTNRACSVKHAARIAYNETLGNISWPGGTSAGSLDQSVDHLVTTHITAAELGAA